MCGRSVKRAHIICKQCCIFFCTFFVKWFSLTSDDFLPVSTSNCIRFHCCRFYFQFVFSQWTNDTEIIKTNSLNYFPSKFSCIFVQFFPLVLSLDVDFVRDYFTFQRFVYRCHVVFLCVDAFLLVCWQVIDMFLSFQTKKTGKLFLRFLVQRQLSSFDSKKKSTVSFALFGKFSPLQNDKFILAAPKSAKEEAQRNKC